MHSKKSAFEFLQTVCFTSAQIANCNNHFAHAFRTYLLEAEKTCMPSHTKIMIMFMRRSRQNEVETQQPYCVTQVHENEFAYSASRLHAAIRRFTLNNPIKKQKQLF